MEEDTIQKILKSVKGSENKQEIIKNLSSLRGLVNRKEQFTIVLKYGGIAIVIGYLRKFHNNAHIVTIGLSILGNCCTDRDCVKEVIKHNGIQLMSEILKNSSHDSIICRTFRIIGNIAQFDYYVAEVHKYNIVPLAVHILNKSNTTKDAKQEKGKNNKEKKISIGTKAMAIRVLRILWNSCSNREYMMQNGAIKAVSSVLITYTEKWTKKEYSDLAKKEVEKFLGNILKALLIFSKIGTADCAKQILADGKGFKTLVLLIPINPYVAIKCLTNLSHVATSRSDMANAEAVKCVVKKLKEFVEKYPNERYPTDIVSAFCLFFKHPLNCCEVKKANGLQLILKMLINCKSKRQELMLTAALSSVIFDKKDKDTLRANGIIEIAINCIEKNLKSKEDLSNFDNHQHSKRELEKNTTLNDTYELYNEEKKNFRKRSLNQKESCSSYIKRHCGYGELAFHSDSTPPESPLSSTVSSDDCDMQFSDDSENYSPLCSDFEDNENLIEGVGKEFNISNSDSEKEIENDIYIYTTNVEEKIIHMMISILSRIVYECNASLATKRCMIILLKCSRERANSNNQLSKLLWNIVSYTDNFFHLIKNDIITLLYSLTEKQDKRCIICRKLNMTAQQLLLYISNVAESEEGKTCIFNLMQNGNLKEKQKFLINIPIIVTLKPMLVTIMDTYEGLNILLTSLAEKSNLHHDISVALHKLSRAICLNEPMARFSPKKVHKFNEKYVCDSKSKDIIKIKLDDESTITVDRNFLIKQTPYFEVMLNGSFSESKQEFINLKNVSNDALHCLLNLLQVDYKNMLPQPLSFKLLTILEVLVLTDLYLLDKLTDWLSTCVLQFLLTSETACDIYNWSITSGTNLLRVETVAFLLTFKMKAENRYKLFENIIEDGLINEFKDDVQNLISRYLKIR